MGRLVNLRAVAEFLAVAVCVVTFTFTAMGVFASLFGSGAAGTRDYIEYWSAGRQLIHHANPYESDAILKLELSAVFPSGVSTLVMGNPPTALLLVLPLGLVGTMTGELLWELLLVISLIVSVQILRSMNRSPKNLLHLLGYSFAPALACLLAGQVTLFILLGLVLFLRWHRSSPLLAGASLWFCLLKPHLFLPFGVVLLVWIVFTRSYRILVGTGLALGISSAIVTIQDPQVWTQYAAFMRESRIDRVMMPCLGSMLRTYVPPHTLLLQCLPAGLASVWALARFLKRRNEWELGQGRLASDTGISFCRPIYMVYGPGNPHSGAALRSLSNPFKEPHSRDRFDERLGGDRNSSRFAAATLDLLLVDCAGVAAVVSGGDVVRALNSTY